MVKQNLEAKFTSDTSCAFGKAKFGSEVIVLLVQIFTERNHDCALSWHSQLNAL